MRVAVVAEYYPRAADPALGIWAHRQALAARDAGADVEVFVLHRPVPPKSALRERRGLLAPLRQPLRTERDGLRVTYVPFLAPPRPRSYARWGAWAAPTLKLALRGRFDLVHAHYAVPGGDAARRTRPDLPLVISVHGGDVLGVAERFKGGRETVQAAFAAARLTLANSAAIAERSRALGARDVRVVHLGTDLPGETTKRRETLVTVAHLIERKRHADVIRALWLLRDSHPRLRYLVIGDGPERARLERLADDLGVNVEFTGQLDHAEALAAARRCSLFVMPSVDEAFGVAYIEAMAAGVPAIGARGEPGPEEIGDGLVLVPPGDPERLAAQIAELIDEPRYLHDLGHQARDTVAKGFTWERCGAATVAAYADALR